LIDCIDNSDAKDDGGEADVDDNVNIAGDSISASDRDIDGGKDSDGD
jgi:hypothetical protein